MKYRKKPVVIEAEQFVLPDPANPMRYEAAHVNYSVPSGDPADFCFGKHWISTLEGPHIVTNGDWIIRGVKGEFYPCKPDVFAVTYEPAESNSRLKGNPK